MGKKSQRNNPDKIAALKIAESDESKTFITTNQGTQIADNQNTLKAGERGPSLLEDFIFREKITHFDHERIPERVVHARGEAAHGYFEVYESMKKYTKAAFLQDPKVKTPVFVRFSTVAGSRGSADTVRDVRGFAVKFYTQAGNFDLVGNNIPIFFIQDAIKFPDLIHAVKPEPHNEIPQAASAHDTFWDFVSVMPESLHMIMWVMSDRAIPRSLRMMEGFGIHTFRFINEVGKAHFVKFHWKPLLGVHSLVWDEAQKLAGKDADFHRRDLWEAIEKGNYPEWEFGVQIFTEKEAEKFEFDILDPTKIVPEEIVPVRRIGKMVLNKNPENFFAETEQVAFHPGHIVPGIDFSNDPLLQGRLFSYIDTQISRLGGANFHEIPINRPLCPFHNNQRDGMHRQTINRGQVAYQPNTLANGYPLEASPKKGGFVSYPEIIHGPKIRIRSASFADHYSQATLFWNSQSDVEKDHLVSALQFELSKVTQVTIRQNVVSLLNNIDSTLAKRVAQKLAVPVKPVKNPHKVVSRLKRSQALSMANTVKNTVKSRIVAVLAAEGINEEDLQQVKRALENAGAEVVILAMHLGVVKTASGKNLAVDHTIETMPSIVFDGLLLPNGPRCLKTLLQQGIVKHFVLEAYKHFKTIGFLHDALRFLPEFEFSTDEPGLIIQEKDVSLNAFVKQFIAALAQHRHWHRTHVEDIPA